MLCPLPRGQPTGLVTAHILDSGNASEGFFPSLPGEKINIQAGVLKSRKFTAGNPK